MPYSVKRGPQSETGNPSNGGSSRAGAGKRPNGGAGRGLAMELNPAAVIGIAVAVCVVAVVLWWVVGSGSHSSGSTRLAFPNGASGPPIPGPPGPGR